MASSVITITRGVRKTWDRMDKKQKTVTMAAIAVVFLASLALLVSFSKGTKYEALWSNLDPQDAGAIISELESQSIPYQISSSGKTISVPQEDVHRLRLSLAAQGLPNSGIVGLESIGQSGIWATDFERKVQYVRAISGELARTVKAIVGIEDARVHVVIGESSVFTTQDKPASAAVMVKARAGYEIPAETVKGIINLVSCSVEGLLPQDVAVIDSKGNLLSQNYVDSLGQFGEAKGAFYETTGAVEKDLEKRLMGLLSPVLGAGNVVCQVQADLALDQIRIVDTTHPVVQDPIVRSTEQRAEDFKGAGGSPSGQAGGLDVPSYGISASGDQEYRVQESVTNYEVNQVVTETLVMPGKIQKLSVAVIVNKILDDDSKAQIEDTVMAALGLDPERQDTVNVSGIPFDTTLSKQLEQALAAAPEPVFPKFYIYAIAVAVALVLGTIIMVIGRKKRQQEPTAAYGPVSTQEDQVEDIFSAVDKTSKIAHQSVEKLARTNPSMVAALLKSWIMEDDR